MKNSGRSQLLNFINEFSGMQHSKIEELSSGVAYLNSFSKLFPKVVSHKKIIENPKHDGDSIKNFEILVQYFKRCRVPRATPDSFDNFFIYFFPEYLNLLENQTSLQIVKR